MVEGNGMRYGLKWNSLEIIWLASANVVVRVAQRSTSLTHIHSLCLIDEASPGFKLVVEVMNQ